MMSDNLESDNMPIEGLEGANTVGSAAVPPSNNSNGDNVNNYQSVNNNNNNRGNNDDEFVDDTPDFVTDQDAVEVVVDDDDVPMDDDDDDESVQQEQQQSPDDDIVDTSVAKLVSHTEPVYAVDSHYDPVTGTLTIVSGGGDDKAYLHQVKYSTIANNSSSNNNTIASTDTTSVLLPHEHTDSVSCVTLNLPYITDPNTPRLAAVGSFDGNIVLYNIETASVYKVLQGPTDVECLNWHHKGGTVLLAGSATDTTVWMYHVVMDKVLQVLVGHEAAVRDGGFTPDGKWILSASADGTLRVWAPRTGNCRHVFQCNNNNNNPTDVAGLTCMATKGGSDGQSVIVGAENGQVHVCHVGSKKIVASFRHYEIPNNNLSNNNNNDDEDDDVTLPMSVEAVGFCTTNPNWCASGGIDGNLKIWDLTTSQCRQTCRPLNDNEGITRLEWHKSLPLVFTATTKGNLRLWDARNGALLATCTGHTDVINDMVVRYTSDDGTAIIVTGSDDNTVRVFTINVASAIQQQSQQQQH